MGTKEPGMVESDDVMTEENDTTDVIAKVNLFIPFKSDGTVLDASKI